VPSGAFPDIFADLSFAAVAAPAVPVDAAPTFTG
jgi:hypothetical protein